MSRRKQENPQPRKRILNTEPSPVLATDLLTCGVCQKEYSLSKIVRFIQHKVQSCGRDQCFDGLADYKHDSENEEGNSGLTCTPLGIVAPLNCRKIFPGQDDKAQTECDASNLSETLKCWAPNDPKKRFCENTPEASEHFFKKKKVLDAESNTMSTEPSSLKCFHCRQSFNSAWELMRHAQTFHELRVYCDSAPGTPEESKPALLKTSDGTRPAIEGVTVGASAPPHISGFDSNPTFNFLKMPSLNDRPFPPPFTSHALFNRPPHHPDFRMDQIIPDQYRFGAPLAVFPPPFERPPFPGELFDRSIASSRPGSSPQCSLGLEPKLDFYSQRLRQLAGTSSPSVSPSLAKPNNLSPFPTTSRRSTPPNSSQCLPSLPYSQSDNCSSASPITSQNSGQDPSDPQLTPNSSLPPRDKECDICGKLFRFHSNLIIHKKGHRDNRPYKCSFCLHQYQRASRLRKHIKRCHSNNEERDGSKSEKDNSSDDSNLDDFDDDDVDEDEDLDGDDDESEDDDNHDNGDKENGDPCEEVEDLSVRNSQDGPEEKGGRDTGESRDIKPETPHENRDSTVVGKLMEKIGFSNLQQYNNVYIQAIQKSCTTKIKDDIPLTNGGSLLREGNSPCDKPNTRSPLMPNPQLDLPHSAFLSVFGGTFDPEKRFKFNLENHNHMIRGRDPFLSNPWIPPINSALAQRDWFAHPKNNSASALKSPVPGCGSEPLSGMKMPPSNLSVSSSRLSLPSSRSPRTPTPECKISRRKDTCEYCGKVFKNCSNLTVHRRSHTGEKPYKCELCSYACAQSSKLTRHMKTHGRLGKDVYRCRFCDMPFSVASTLEKHMRKCVVNQNKKLSSLGLPTVTADVENAAKTAHFGKLVNSG